MCYRRTPDVLLKSGENIVNSTVTVIKDIPVENVNVINQILPIMRTLLDLDKFRDYFFQHFEILMEQLLSLTGASFRNLAYAEAFQLASKFTKKASANQYLFVIVKLISTFNDPVLPIICYYKFIPLIQNYIENLSKSQELNSQTDLHYDVNRVILQVFEAIQYKLAYIRKNIKNV